MTLAGFSKAGLYMGLGALAALTLVQVGCAAGETTNPTTVDGLKGYTLRVIHPGEMVSMLYMAGRVTVTVDKDSKITNVAFY
jgi:hypothetical protein